MRLHLFLLSVVVVLSGCLFDGPSGDARHAWSVSIKPEGQGSYEMDVPFLVDHSGRYPVMFEALREKVRVGSGSASVSWMDGTEGYLRVVGDGPVVLEAVHVFRGTVGEREAFKGWFSAGNEVRSVTGPALVVTWSVDHSGGQGHTCWGSGAWETRVPSGGRGFFVEGEERDLHMDVVCA